MFYQISILLAFAAGLLSFLSPCVLPLIPSYLAFLGGMANKRHLVAATLSFILGFSAVFTALSILFSGTFLLLGGAARYINIAAGIIVILLGLNVLFDFLKFLNYEKRAALTGRPKGFIGAFLVGIAFGAGWSPCVGPILGSILLMAGQSGKAGQAMLYLAVYSAGLGLPFLAAAVFFNRFLKGAAKLRSRLPLIKRISGIFLIGIGVFILLGQYQRLNIFLLKAEYAFSSWAKTGDPPVQVLPAILFFIIAALPPAFRLFKKRPLRSWPLIIFSGIFSILGIVQAAGILDSAGLLARWLLYRQTI
ncbi:cytochrome c biogenesis CcdA family protein [Treponema primitia]|uniref:cytochrome c biogenesis CcdA family protein n=1 Tax=Treponema primitia TaxID=88058 RepID=UPI00397F05F2